MSISAISFCGGLYLIIMGFVVHRASSHSTALGRLNGPSTVESGFVFVLIAAVLGAIGR